MPAKKLPPPSEIVKKTLDRARAAPADWEGGMKKAAGTITANMKAAVPRWVQAIQDAIQNKHFEKGIAQLTDDQIIAAAVRVGGNTWLSGLTSREDKLLRAWEVLATKLQGHMEKIAAMANVTDADREARMVANLRGMKKLGKRA